MEIWDRPNKSVKRTAISFISTSRLARTFLVHAVSVAVAHLCLVRRLRACDKLEICCSYNESANPSSLFFIRGFERIKRVNANILEYGDALIEAGNFLFCVRGCRRQVSIAK
jgi:hypothetical protein